MRTVAAILAVVGMGASWAALRAGVPEALREPGVLYLDENLPEKLELKLSKPTRVYFDRVFESPAGAFAAGQVVRVIGVDGHGYLVSGDFRGNRLDGWVRTADVPPIDPKILQQAEAAQRKRDAIRLAIEQKRVIEGMSFDEVRKSLGRPERASFREEVGRGRIDTWSYITFELVPEIIYAPSPFGGIAAQTVYNKVPIGELTIDFANGEVVAIEEHRKSTDRLGVRVPMQPKVPPQP